MIWTWVEPFAGAAACSLRLVGGRYLAPPVGWMGGKRRYASEILGAMGVPEGRPSRVVLCDAGPWGWVWPLLLNPETASLVAAHLREWSSEHPRSLWDRLAAQPPAESLPERAAGWLWLQARSASGVPIWWDGWRPVMGKTEGRKSTQPAWQKGGGEDPADDRGEDLRWPGHQAQREAWMASDGRGEPRPAGARAVGGRWEKGHPDGCGAQDASRGQRGWLMGEEHKESRRGDRTLSEKGTSHGRTGGMVNPGTIAARIMSIAESFRGVERDVRHGDAAELEPVPGALVYLDPPYQGATGYGWDCPRKQVLDLAKRWATAGAVVAVSEAVPLELPGWHHLDLTRPGGKPEWLTISRAPVRVHDRQLELFEGHP